MRTLFVLLFAALLLVSCKQPPNLDDAGFYAGTDNGKKVFYTIESAFYITSTNRGKGIQFNQGYTKRYLNAVNPENGVKINTVKLKGVTNYIGSAGGKAWFFSVDPTIGLHARNPVSLDIIVESKNIIDCNPELKSGLSEKADDFSIDTSGRFMFITANDGYCYLIDPLSLKALRTDKKAATNYYWRDDDLLQQSIFIHDSLQISFRGNPREFLIREKNSNQGTEELKDISFIEPGILTDRTEKIFFKETDNFNVPLPCLKDSNTIFILSHSNLSPHTFNWVISALYLDFYTAKIVWQKEISQTEKISFFDKPFLKAGIENNYLILVFKNMLLGIDKKTGNITWRKNYITKSR